MFVKPLIIAFVAACTVGASNPTPTTATAEPPADPPDYQPPVEKPKDSHWCCKSVDPKTASGEDCTSISGTPEVINACAEYLNCSGSAAKHDGKVTCLD
jgi:hypothetical protein